MATGASLQIGLNGVDPKHYSGWDGHLTCYVLLDTSWEENYIRSA
jgi:hypothetical protein